MTGFGVVRTLSNNVIKFYHYFLFLSVCIDRMGICVMTVVKFHSVAVEIQ